MKKRLRLKITGKILLILLGLSLASLLLFSFVALNYMASLGRSALESTASLGASAVKDSTDALKKQAQDQLITVAADQAAISDAMFDKVESEVSMAAAYAGQILNNPQMYPSGQPNTQSERPPTIYANSVGLPAPGTPAGGADSELRLLSNLDSVFISVFQNDRNLAQIYVSTEYGSTRLYPWAGNIPEGFDPRRREWYLQAKELKGPGWTGTTTDAVSGRKMVTCFKPFYSTRGELLGVAAADVTIETINQKIINTQIANNGYAFLLDSQGNILAHPSMQIRGKTWDEAVETGNIFNSRDPALGDIALDMVAGNTGVGRCWFDGGEKFIAYSPILRTGWTIGIAMPVDEIVAPVEATRERINSATAGFEARTGSEIRGMLAALAGTSLLIVVIVAGAAFLLARRITRPIVTLSSGAQAIGRGDLDHKLEVHTGDELQDLAESFNKMAADLKEYIRDLQETTSAKERIESELRVAQEIQASMLPRLFPPFPDRKEFDLHATMVPAREVGGDFYDFFFTTPDKLCIIIGDVCGKGIPAALFMAICKTLLRTEALHSDNPEEVLFHVNNILCPDNEASMFVTVLCALLDTNTGELVIANGGHNPPLTCAAGGDFEYMSLARGLVVGAMDDTVYSSSRCQLKPGDMLVMYTDGVTEAMDGEGRLYSEPRLLDSLNRLKGMDVGKIIHDEKADIEAFAGGTPQSDDITMIVLKFNGPDGAQT